MKYRDYYVISKSSLGTANSPLNSNRISFSTYSFPLYPFLALTGLLESNSKRIYIGFFQELKVRFGQNQAYDFVYVYICVCMNGSQDHIKFRFLHIEHFEITSWLYIGRNRPFERCIGCKKWPTVSCDIPKLLLPKMLRRFDLFVQNRNHCVKNLQDCKVEH